MVRKLYSTISVLLTAIILVSCSNNVQGFLPYNYSVENEDNHATIVRSSYTQYGQYQDVDYVDFYDAERSINFYDSFNYNNKQNSLLTTGEIDLLVVPVEFLDHTFIEDVEVSHEDLHNDISNAFFGDSSINEFYSVAEYYDISSYGKLKIKGDVTSVYTSNYNAADLIDEPNISKIMDELLNSITTWYVDNGGDLTKYDLDNDGTLDSAYLIYSYPFIEPQNGYNSFFWAYVSYKPEPVAWTSYYFLKATKYSKLDSRVVVHETAHILGIQDYYDRTNSKKPTGGMDIMDHTLGDHTPYTKMLMDWTRPYYLTGEGEITLNAFNETGEVILINNVWNKSAMDEYILIDFYAPRGLNAYDSVMLTEETSLYKTPGVRVMHVDSRLAFVNNSNDNFKSYVEDGKMPSANDRIMIHNNNSFSEDVLYTLLRKNTQNNETLNTNANDDDLYKVGDVFGDGVYSNYTYHDGRKLEFGFEVMSMNNFETTLRFFNV